MLRWCPSPYCHLAIKASDLLDSMNYRQNCECECGHKFCFNCSENAHDPIPCNLMEIWKNKVSEHAIGTAPEAYTLDKNGVPRKYCPRCNLCFRNDDSGSNKVVCTIQTIFIFMLRLISVIFQTCCLCHKDYCWKCLKFWNECVCCSKSNDKG